MATIVINLSDEDSRGDMEDYIRDVAMMIGRGYTSGHTDRFTHWESDLHA